MLLNNIRTFYPKIDIKRVPTAKWFTILLYTRAIILDRFLNKAWNTRNSDGPAKWLAFHTSCSPSFDPFNTLFQLFILETPDLAYAFLRSFTTGHLDRLVKDDKRRLYYCIYEAQCDLEQCDFELVEKPIPMLRIELACIISNRLSAYRKPEPKNIFIAGTSLRMNEASCIIQDVKSYDEATYKYVMTGCKKHVDFPLLTTEEDFKRLLKQHDIRVPEGYLTHVEKWSVPLRGRYRWSVLYIDRLKLLQNGGWTPKAIENEAQRTMREAKIQLQKRLEVLEKQNQTRLLDQLCQVAIQSDLLDKPTIFEDDKDCEMISEAFAVVKPIGKDQNQYRSQLQEQLALEAVIEFFRDRRPQQYDEKLRRFLFSQQNDAGALGKVAEWFLAWELRKCLHNSQRMTGSPENILHRRKAILANLGNAENLKQRHRCLEDYCLLEGERTGHCYDQRLKDIPIYEWMASIRNGKKPAASFYLPDNLAGPDILFALQHSKTSAKTPGDSVILLGPSITAVAIETTNPRSWYTGKNPNLWRDEQKRQADLNADKRTSENEYFVRLDKRQTENLFGAAFFRLMVAMKNKEKDVKKLDEITHGKRGRNNPGPADPRAGKKSKR
ncbi:hypothetical protein EPUS_03150 [Endocarpon pusillum Z07020]|uniref:Uncharacterized protein n=1 Tax=Endocarpon pusillum (strain Z07020 / HMAS-L-300199) TaxID=1263415 RepID=U1G7C8_ENDPU|nr:uncharacterized protein EPUS_03150 [Endocarpon pusillum Z07020]ERF73317.1 hypothetical protein EPUS_03150 [Endocarpon pusillum Z07020]